MISATCISSMISGAYKIINDFSYLLLPSPASGCGDLLPRASILRLS
jgi:hypothetical protein